MMEYQRKKTRQIHIGPVAIGGGAPISVQSMTNTKTADTEATLAQIRALAQAGCDIVRLAVPDMAAAKNLGSILAASPSSRTSISTTSSRSRPSRRASTRCA